MSSAKEYVEKHLGNWVTNDPEFKNRYSVTSVSVKATDQLDGFMAMILTCKLGLQSNTNNEKREVPIVVKVMKGDHDFRTTSKSFVQCRNEIYIYEKVIPALKQFIKDHQGSIEADQWTPKVYKAFYGKIPEISDIDECVLVMENLSVSGFRNGPRLLMDMNHLTMMVRTIAQYHGVQYAMRIENDPTLEALKRDLIPLSWKEDTENLFDILYTASFERLYEYLDRHPEAYNSDQMKEEVGLMRKLFYKDPVNLLELFKVDDKPFSVIQHGDYNRNNVLFQYAEKEGFDNPLSMRMIDFQEVRYGSPANDLFFFWYMSTNSELREKHWDELLQLYQSEVWKHLKDLLKCEDSDPRLQQYSYENFQKHFARYAFYGFMVTNHFLPWMDCVSEEAEQLSTEFTVNMRSDKFKKLLLTCGGDASTKKIVEALQHAVSRGYLSFIKNL